MVGLAIDRPMQQILPPDLPAGGYYSSLYRHTAGSSTRAEERYKHSSRSTLSSSSHLQYPHSSGAAATALSIATSTGLRTPPPDKRAVSSTMHPHSYVDGAFLKQFEPPIPSSIPKMIDPFLSAQQQHFPRLFESPQSRRGSVLSRCSSADKSLANPTSTKNSSTLTESVLPYKMSESRRSSRAIQLPALPPLLAKSIRGTIADFAAEMICFFWFESSFLLHRIDEASETPGILQDLSRDAVPTPAFRKWVTNILTTTQVSTNVIILALLFVHRLKKLNPSVRGKTGSEYRMITVALMLGNKFLDDNTYTNKTWADVSNISVKEIHIMEVEFLQNMKYNLFTSEKQWSDWQFSMLRFWSYWDMAARMTLEMTSRPQRSPISGIPPSFPSPISQQSSSPMVGTISSASSLPYPAVTLHALSTPSSMPLVELPFVSRKRSIDETDPLMQPPPAKRLSRSMAPNISIDIPHFPMQIPPPTPLSAGFTQRLPPVCSGSNHPQQAAIPPLQSGQLPFPGPGGRAMSMLFSSPSQNWHQGPTSAPPLTHNITIPTFHPQSRSSSPYLQNLSNTPSPTSSFSSQQPQRLSPSVLLGNRPSPYRPVRGVSSLLVPSAATNPAPVCNVDQIQYHPIAKTRTQYKTGVLPYLPDEFVWGLEVAPHSE